MIRRLARVLWLTLALATGLTLGGILAALALTGHPGQAAGGVLTLAGIGALTWATTTHTPTVQTWWRGHPVQVPCVLCGAVVPGRDIDTALDALSDHRAACPAVVREAVDRLEQLANGEGGVPC